MLLSDYLGIGYKLDANGVFDPILDEDSHFFINLQRLKNTSVPEFSNSYDRIRAYFNNIIKLLDRAQKKDKEDVFYKQALKLFSFSEVNGICLGYAKGISGAGFGPGLSKQVISTAYDIVKAGIDDPEFFELLPLFQENVGADRLSDMIATLILQDIRAYTKRVNSELGINPKRYKRFFFSGDFLINPYKHDDVLLVPIDILHKLPVAESWEDIELVVSQNSVLRAEINQEVAAEWNKYSTYERKTYLRQTVFQDQNAFRRVIDNYRQVELGGFDPRKDFSYFLAKLIQEINELDIDYKTNNSTLDSFTASLEILEHFQDWIENNKGWEVVWAIDSSRREKVLQKVIHGQAKAFIKANKLDMSCEPDEGRGPVDFKVSKGDDITLIEVKLSSSNQYLHGYETQIVEYGRAEKTNNLIYVLLDLGNPSKIRRVQESHDRQYNEGGNPPFLFVIDAKKKVSASIV